MKGIDPDVGHAIILGMRYLILPALLALAACGDRPGLFARTSSPDNGASAVTGPYSDIRPNGRPGDEVEAEVTEAAMPAETTAVAPATGALGVTIASLGNAAEPGLWLKTPLVRAEGPGMVTYSGKSVEANLIPIEGAATAGSRASLQLMQALGAPLTGLPEVSVSR